jgi:adenylate cyclase
VRGSTTIAEKVAPDVWIAQLNEYLSEMSDAIFVYDGYLDKFMGDGIMAMWNAFGNQPDHAELATKAAAQMLERLKALNEQWEGQEERVPLQIGIGLHTGEAIIGNVGSYRRTQYTAIGDSVNAASRIEALTKEFKAQLLLSETTVELLGGRVKLVELGEAELKGRAQPIRVYKPEGYPGEVIGRMQQMEK